MLTAAALSIAMGCGMSDTLARHAAAIALRENPRLDVHAVNHNTNGSTDFGLTQVNTINFGWLSMAMHKPINAQTILDPCTNLEAGLRIEFVRFNGHPPPAIAAAYSTRALETARAVDGVATAPIPQASNPAPPEEVVLDDRPAWNDDQPQHEGK